MEYGGEHRWTARDRAVVTRMVQYPDRGECMKVEIEELECCFLGPEESTSVTLRRTQGAKSVASFFRSSVERGQSELLVASAARCDEYSSMRSRHKKESKSLSKL